MKKTIIALATLSALSNVAFAQSNVTMYGVLDETARYSTNVDKSNHGQFQLVDGIVSGTRLGFKGSEDLGNGTKAIFNLEAGFSLSNGTSQQGSRLFGRNAFVGLSDKDLGTLTLGRQNTLAYDFDLVTDVYSFGSTLLSSYQGALTGLRFDNEVKYVNARGPFSIGLAYAFGDQTGDTSKNSSYGVSTGYTMDALDLRAVYQHTGDTKDATPGTLAGQDQRLAAVGGSYKFSSVQVFGQYFDNKFDVSGQKNRISVLGASYNLTPQVNAKASFAHDKQTGIVAAGNRNTVSGVLSYAFSPRTDVYTEVDHNNLSGKYANASYTYNTAANTNSSGTGVSLGLRHKF